MQRVEIPVGGRAQSIDMYTLRCNAWELTPGNDKILLPGETTGAAFVVFWCGSFETRGYRCIFRGKVLSLFSAIE